MKVVLVSIETLIFELALNEPILSIGFSPSQFSITEWLP